MALLVAIHPVKDYDAWKQAFDSRFSVRGKSGVTRHWVFRSADNENEVLVAIEVDTTENAERLLTETGDLKAYLDRVGIEIYPAVFIGEQVEVVEYPPDAAT